MSQRLIPQDTRSVPEWIGRSPDSAIPPRVKLRIIERYGRRCYLTGDVLVPGQIEFEHVIAIVNGGTNRESNIAPANRPAHQIKTRADTAIKTKRAKSLKKRYGLTKPKRPMDGSKASPFKKHMDGSVSMREPKQ
ncbi:MAG: HNH endonuclease [Hyphomicrobiaceae bacterium]|nr:HNH endonuclease [Hyphomicrobiaceae bacterium]